jgi:hypothetical protein
MYSRNSTGSTGDDRDNASKAIKLFESSTQIFIDKYSIFIVLYKFSSKIIVGRR